MKFKGITEISNRISIKPVLKRFFLVVFFIGFLFVVFFLTKSKLDHSASQVRISTPDFLKSQCPFYLGLSFFPIKKQKIEKNFVSPDFSFWSQLISKRKFIDILKNFEQIFQNKILFSGKKLFTFPLVLSKDNHWLVSQNTFIILSNGERKEISHLTYAEITDILRNPDQDSIDEPLNLETLLFHLPDQNFLFYLEGSNREKMITSLREKLKDRIKEFYLSSSNDRLLDEMMLLEKDWNILHSFKTLLRWKIMNLIFLGSWSLSSSRGFIIPGGFPLSSESWSFLQSRKKFLFFKKDPPYDPESRVIIRKSHALISSQPDLALKTAISEKPCLIKN